MIEYSRKVTKDGVTYLWMGSVPTSGMPNFVRIAGAFISYHEYVKSGLGPEWNGTFIEEDTEQSLLEQGYMST